MKCDIHVHVAQLHRHESTDRFVVHKPNRYVRMFLRQLGMSREQLRQPTANALVRDRLLYWASAATIDRFVLLAMDGAFTGDGQSDPAASAWIVDNQFVAELARSHPSLLFGASVHPYRKDALALTGASIDAGACLMKWIPSTQRIRLDDPRCLPVYDLLAASGVPLLVHTGNEHSGSGGPNRWNAPELLVTPLRRGVKVIAAHCGARLFLHERSGFDAFCRMAREHEHLYGDLGAFAIPTRIRPLRALQRDPLLLSKVVYGSDFPAITMAEWFVFSIGLPAVRRILREPNPLERPYLLMRSMGLPDEVFTRGAGILRLPALAREAS